MLHINWYKMYKYLIVMFNNLNIFYLRQILKTTQKIIIVLCFKMHM